MIKIYYGKRCSGKTVKLLKEAQKMVYDGFIPVFVCVNKNVAKSLKEYAERLCLDTRKMYFISSDDYEFSTYHNKFVNDSKYKIIVDEAEYFIKEQLRPLTGDKTDIILSVSSDENEQHQFVEVKREEWDKSTKFEIKDDEISKDKWILDFVTNYFDVADEKEKFTKEDVLEVIRECKEAYNNSSKLTITPEESRQLANRFSTEDFSDYKITLKTSEELAKDIYNNTTKANKNKLREKLIKLFHDAHDRRDECEKCLNESKNNSQFFKDSLDRDYVRYDTQMNLIQNLLNELDDDIEEI